MYLVLSFAAAKRPRPRSGREAAAAKRRSIRPGLEADPGLKFCTSLPTLSRIVAHGLPLRPVEFLVNIIMAKLGLASTPQKVANVL